MTAIGTGRWAATSLVACIGLGFLAPEPSWAAWFYLVVLPLGACSIRPGWRPDRQDASLLLLAGLVLWSTMTLAWADQPHAPWFRQWLWLWNGVCTGGFLLMLTGATERSPAMRERIVAVLVGCGALNAAGSIGLFLLHGGGERLQGWAESRNAILGASIMGVCTLFALARALRPGPGRIAWAAAVPLFIAFIVLTGSRGPWLALLVAVGFVLPPRSLRIYAAVLIGLVLTIAAVVLIHPEWTSAIADRLLERGTSYRLAIWQESLAEIARRPILGHGLTASLRIEGAFGHHPHNLYLSVAFYSGGIGLLLLLAALVRLMRDVLRLPHGADRRIGLALLVHVMLSGVTDLSQITKGPGELWYIVWLPLGYVLGVLRDPATRFVAQSRVRSRAGAWATVATRITAPRSAGKISRSV